jgi:hypothetical protein
MTDEVDLSSLERKVDVSYGPQFAIPNLIVHLHNTSPENVYNISLTPYLRHDVMTNSQWFPAFVNYYISYCCKVHQGKISVAEATIYALRTLVCACIRADYDFEELSLNRIMNEKDPILNIAENDSFHGPVTRALTKHLGCDGRFLVDLLNENVKIC